MAKKYPKRIFKKLNRLSLDHLKRITHHSKKCGCYNCGYIFDSSELKESDYKHPLTKLTVICPKCGIDSIISEEEGIKITEEFLNEVSKLMFE